MDVGLHVQQAPYIRRSVLSPALIDCRVPRAPLTDYACSGIVDGT